jgi:Fe-S-cluster containining protein
MPKPTGPQTIPGTISAATAEAAGRVLESYYAARPPQPAPFDLPEIPAPTSCSNCGACCLHMGYPPFAGMYPGGDPDWLALRESHPQLAQECRQGAVDGRGDRALPCLWLDPATRQCKHYELRPACCREFELGSEECIGHRERRPELFA